MPPNEFTRRTVDRIRTLIAQVAAAQKPYVARICPRCASPCCLRVHYVYSRDDRRYLRMLGKNPPWTGKAFLSPGCWFLGSCGCRIEPEVRPMLCHRYLCDDLKKEMTRRDPRLVDSLYENFKRIETLRRELLKGCDG